jgi:preprotein translocase subunit SecY
MLIIIRIGSQLPIPGVDNSVFASWFEGQNADAFSFFDAVTGGSFYQMSIFALNITPYITSSIIMQLLTIAIPKLEEMQKDGEEGRKKIVEYTRYLTIVLALVEAVAMAYGFWRGNSLDEKNALSVISVVTCLVAGSAVLMWIGERITENGIGNGISIVLVINIISRIPQDLGTLWEQFIAGKTPAKGTLAAVIIVGIILLMTVFVILLQMLSAESRFSTQRRFREENRLADSQATFL